MYKYKAIKNRRGKDLYLHIDIWNRDTHLAIKYDHN